MADKILNVSLDVSKVDKSWLFKGKKGTYANLTIFYNEEKDEYGQNGMVVQQVPKELYEKDKSLKGPILGNVSEFVKGGGGAAEAKADREGASLVGDNTGDLPDDLPF